MIFKKGEFLCRIAYWFHTLDFHLHKKRLDDASLFPITFQFDELNWKLSVGIDLAGGCFTLSVNDVPFMSLPYQATISPDGPQIQYDSGRVE